MPDLSYCSNWPAIFTACQVVTSQHVDMLEHITVVPNANPAIDGVVFSRGQVIPALNLRVRFGFPRIEKNLKTRIVFATIHDRTVGLIVDAARDFKNFSSESLNPIEKTLTGINDKYLTAVTKLGERLVSHPGFGSCFKRGGHSHSSIQPSGRFLNF